MDELCCGMVMKWRDSDTVFGEKGYTTCSTQLFLWRFTCLLAMRFTYQFVFLLRAMLRKWPLFACLKNIPSCLRH
jgi:hypothetical protein